MKGVKVQEKEAGVEGEKGMNNKRDFNHLMIMETEQANILHEEVRVNDLHEEHSKSLKRLMMGQLDIRRYGLPVLFVCNQSMEVEVSL